MFLMKQCIFPDKTIDSDLNFFFELVHVINIQNRICSWALTFTDDAEPKNT